jgi:hypothetical protein
MDLYHLRQGLHVIAASWDYHRGAKSRVSVCGNSIRFGGDGCGDGCGGGYCALVAVLDTLLITLSPETRPMKFLERNGQWTLLYNLKFGLGNQIWFVWPG